MAWFGLYLDIGDEFKCRLHQKNTRIEGIATDQAELREGEQKNPLYLGRVPSRYAPSPQ